MDSALTPMLDQLMTHVLSINLYRDDVKGTGLWLGGKTGTAQIWSAKLHAWLRYQQNFSFVGFAGRTAGHPDLIIVVKIGGARPAIAQNGALILAIKPTELFRRIATDAVTTPGLLPADPPTTNPTTAQAGG